MLLPFFLAPAIPPAQAMSCTPLRGRPARLTMQLPQILDDTVPFYRLNLVLRISWTLLPHYAVPNANSWHQFPAWPAARPVAPPHVFPVFPRVSKADYLAQVLYHLLLEYPFVYPFSASPGACKELTLTFASLRWGHHRSGNGRTVMKLLQMFKS